MRELQRHSLAAIPIIPQIRMTRRVDGVYTLDEDEVHKEFSDSVGLFPDWKKAGSVYELPFVCLYGKITEKDAETGCCAS